VQSSDIDFSSYFLSASVSFSDAANYIVQSTPDEIDENHCLIIALMHLSCTSLELVLKSALSVMDVTEETLRTEYRHDLKKLWLNCCTKNPDLGRYKVINDFIDTVGDFYKNDVTRYVYKSYSIPKSSRRVFVGKQYQLQFFTAVNEIQKTAFELVSSRAADTSTR
jgi:hypothetical protein